MDKHGMKLWPPSLKAYVARCFQKCVTDVDKNQMGIILKRKIAKASNEEMLWSTNWDEEPMTAALKQPWPGQLEEEHRRYLSNNVPPPFTSGSASAYNVPPPVSSGSSSSYNVPPPVTPGSASSYKVPPPVSTGCFSSYNTLPGGFNIRSTAYNAGFVCQMKSTQVVQKPVAILPEKLADYNKMILKRGSETIKSLKAIDIFHRSQNLRQKEENLLREEEHLRRGEDHFLLMKKDEKPYNYKEPHCQFLPKSSKKRQSSSRGRSSLRREKAFPSREKSSLSRKRDSLLRENAYRSSGRTSPSRERECRYKLRGTRSRSNRRKRPMSQERLSRSKGRRSRSCDGFRHRGREREGRKREQGTQKRKNIKEMEETRERERHPMSNGVKAKKKKCQTCTRSKHGVKPCPALGMDCFDCGKIGHLRNSDKCQKKKEAVTDLRQTLWSVKSGVSMPELTKETNLREVHMGNLRHEELVKETAKATPFGGTENVLGSIPPNVEVPPALPAVTTKDSEAGFEKRQRQQDEDDEHLRQKLRSIMSVAILPELAKEVKTRKVQDDIVDQFQVELVKQNAKATPFGGSGNVLDSLTLNLEVPPAGTTKNPEAAIERRRQGQKDENEVTDDKWQGPGGFVEPKAKVTPFAGKGNVLGSIATTPEPVPAAAIEESEAAKLKADESTASIQVRMPDGSKIVVKLNHSHTVGDLRTYIITVRPQYAGNPFSLLTTIPWLEPYCLHKELTEDEQTIQEAGIIGACIFMMLK